VSAEYHSLHDVASTNPLIVGRVRTKTCLITLHVFLHRFQTTCSCYALDANQTVPPGSIYGATLREITRKTTSEVLERLRLLDLSSVSDGVAHEVFAKVWEMQELRPLPPPPHFQCGDECSSRFSNTSCLGSSVMRIFMPVCLLCVPLRQRFFVGSASLSPTSALTVVSLVGALQQGSFH